MIPEIENHILQSTIFTAAAGLLAFFLRNNHARTRYRIWLAASLKFLVPFSLLIGIGHLLSWPASAPPSPQVSAVAHVISQPFTPVADYAFVARMPAEPVKPEVGMDTILLVIWLCGVCGAVIFWFVRWRRLAAAVRRARRANVGSEWETLCRLRTGASMETSVGLMIASRIEPSVVGLFHPILLLPEGVAGKLEDAELDAIVAHELCHIRRRDNLTAALHMVVEAVFWFYPLVWWIGRKLVEERENACDEAVLTMGSVPEVYAQSILKICRLCLESPLVCAAGVSGADLRKRIESIMTRVPFLKRLGPVGKTAIVAFGTLALAVPVVIGMLSAGFIRAQVPVRSLAAVVAPQLVAQASPVALPSLPSSKHTPAPAADAKLPEFITADVRVSPPSTGRVMTDARISAGHVEFKTTSMRDLIRFAYGVGEDNVVGGPTWLSEDRFDITATSPADSTRESQELMLRALLRDRFGLVVHHETRPLPAFSMTIAKRGVQMKKSADGGESRCAGAPQERVYTAFNCRSTTMADLAKELSSRGGTYFWVTPVVDQTNLGGAWDFGLKFTPRPVTGATIAAGSEAISIFDAVDQQLGLKLELTKLPLDAIVVDHVNEKPSNPSGVTATLAPAPTEFAVASVKPSDPASTRSGMNIDPGGLVVVAGNTLKQLVAFAWNIDSEQIANGPGFMDSERFDITAKAFADDGNTARRTLDEDAIRVMMRALLVDRFRLAVHNEDRPEPAYVLTAGKLKIKAADPSNRSDCQNVPTPGGGPRPRMMACQNTTMAGFVVQLMRFAPGYLHGTPVVNETGVNGAYDITLNFSPAQMLQNNAADDPNGAISLFDAIDKELGLKLDLQKRAMAVVVVDHVEQKPTEN